MHFTVTTLVFADIPGAGRFNVDSVSQQMAMEMLIGRCKGFAGVKDASGNFLRIQDWKGLKFDDTGNVIEIDFSENDLRNSWSDDSDGEDEDEDIPGAVWGDGQMERACGEVDLKWIPETVRKVCFNASNAAGTVETAKFPRGLVKFDTAFNSFYGTFALGGLPETMEIVDIQANMLDGSLDIAAMPRGMHWMNCGMNAFDGNLHLEALPEKMRVLIVEQNELHGSLRMERLPRAMVSLNVRSNKFTQDTLVVDRTGNKELCVQVDRAKFAEIIDGDGNDLSDWILD